LFCEVFPLHAPEYTTFRAQAAKRAVNQFLDIAVAWTQGQVVAAA